jgi:hypothetical protein
MRKYFAKAWSAPPSSIKARTLGNPYLLVAVLALLVSLIFLIDGHRHVAVALLIVSGFFNIIAQALNIQRGRRER